MGNGKDRYSGECGFYIEKGVGALVGWIKRQRIHQSAFCWDIVDGFSAKRQAL
jgi:hypothetical protein